MTLIVAAGPLHAAFGLEAMVATSYQAAGGAGQSGMDELLLLDEKLDGRVAELRTEGAALERSIATSVFPRPLAWNVVPHCGSYRDDRYTDEERKLVDESRRILELPDLVVSPTFVRVPGIVGRIREDYGDARSISLFTAGDDLLKGAALNAVQITELVR